MVDRLANSEANHRRILMVENAFGSAGESLQHTGRVLVGEGVLTKICRKKPKPRQFFLFNDILVYGNIVLDKKKYNKQHIMALGDVQLTSLEDDGELKYGWQIMSPSKSFAVYAATSTEKAEWMAHITKCINDLRKKSGMAGPSIEGAAVWVPDHNANSCMVCQKAKFSALNRRHHCRKCGTLVCGNCSKNKWLLPQISNKPVRICDRCYSDLQNGSGSSSSATEKMEGAAAATKAEPVAAAAADSTPAEAPHKAKGENSKSAAKSTEESSGRIPSMAFDELLPAPPPPTELLSDDDLPMGDPSRLSQIQVGKVTGDDAATASTMNTADDSSEDESTVAGRTKSVIDAKAGSSDEEEDDDDDEKDKQSQGAPAVFFVLNQDSS